MSSSLLHQRAFQPRQTPAHGAVDDRVAGIDHGTADDGRIDALEAAMPLDQVVGARYAPAGMERVNR